MRKLCLAVFFVQILSFSLAAQSATVHWVFITNQEKLPGTMVLLELQGKGFYSVEAIAPMDGQASNQDIPTNANSGIPEKTFMICQSFMSENTDNYAVAKAEGAFKVFNLTAMESSLSGWSFVRQIDLSDAFLRNFKITPATKFTIPAFTRVLSNQKPVINGQDVLLAQYMLWAKGFGVVGQADGWFGGNSEKAVREFQKKQNIRVTGVIDETTWESLMAF